MFGRIVLLFLALACLPVNAQSVKSESAESEIAKDSVINVITMTGNVSDLAPLPNIVVFEKGDRNNVAVTDANGNFSLNIPLSHFTEKVFLRFEVLGKKPMDKQVSATTKHLKIHYNPDKPRKEKWKVDVHFEKPETSEIIAHELNKLIFLASHIKRK